MAAIVVLCMQVFVMAYSHVSYLFQDEICGDFVAELLDFIDYAMMVEDLVPPRLYRQSAGFVRASVIGSGSIDDPYDLTDDDVADLPVATRLDFTIVCDELDNGGLFGT